MNKAELVSRVRGIAAEHESDGDGGYATVDAVELLWSSLPVSERRFLEEALLELAVSGERSVRGIALESVVRVGAAWTAVGLRRVLDDKTEKPEWRDSVAMALLQLGDRETFVTLRPYVQARLRSGVVGVPLAAALARIAPQVSVDILAAAIATWTKSGLDEQARGYAPTIIRNYLDVDEQLLPKLVARTAAHGAAAGRWLADVLGDGLSKPWMRQELGAQRVSDLKQEIERMLKH